MICLALPSALKRASNFQPISVVPGQSDCWQADLPEARNGWKPAVQKVQSEGQHRAMNRPCVGMRKGGRSAAYIFGVWCTIAILSGLAALVGNVALAGTSPEMIAASTAVAAGAILAMLADTIPPEAFETAHEYAGPITVAGFLCAFLPATLGS
jgi:hypothetical protein